MEVALAHAAVGVEDLLDPDVRERQAACARGRAREHRLPAAGRAEEEHAAAGSALVLLVEVGALKRQDDRPVDGLLDVVEPADVREADGRLRVELELRREWRAVLADALLHDLDEML